MAPLAYAEPPSTISAKENLLNLSFDELALITVIKSSTLTETKLRLVPASVTVITQKDISASGARTLNELLMMYVPGLQLIRHGFGPSHIGTRGHVTGADNYITLIN